jgi:hypothetical protein
VAEPRKTTGSLGEGDLEAWKAEIAKAEQAARQAALPWWRREASWVQALWRAVSNYRG